MPKCLTIAFRPGIIITDVVQQLIREHPELAINAIRIKWDEQKACITSEIRLYRQAGRGVREVRRPTS